MRRGGGGEGAERGDGERDKTWQLKLIHRSVPLLMDSTNTVPRPWTQAPDSSPIFEQFSGQLNDRWTLASPPLFRPQKELGEADKYLISCPSTGAVEPRGDMENETV